MQVCELTLIIAVNRGRWFTKSAKDGAKHCDVFYKEGMKLIEKGHTSCYSFDQLQVGLLNVFLFFNLRIELEKLKVWLPIAHLSCLLEHQFCFVKVSCYTMTFHIKDAHPVCANETILLSTHVVIAGSFFLVRFISRLCMSKFSDGIASPTTAIWGLPNDSLESLHDLFQVRLTRKADIVISLVFNRGNMPIFGSSLYPIHSLGLVLRDFLRANTLNKKPAEHVTSIICLLGVVWDQSLKFCLS